MHNYEESNKNVVGNHGDQKCEISAEELKVVRLSKSDSESSHSFKSPGLFFPVSESSDRPGKIKFLCSFGGKILPRPSDGKLRYVGGDTRIISTGKNVSWEELMKKISAICKHPHIVKYQLPGEDLDSLVSVSSDEDLQNMLEEYHEFEKPEGFLRIRIFLLPSSEYADSSCTFDANIIQENDPEYQFVVAVNGMTGHLTPNVEQDSQKKESFSGSLAHQGDLKNDSQQLGEDKLSLGSTTEGIGSSSIGLPHPSYPSRGHSLILYDSPLMRDLTEDHGSRRAKHFLDESSSHTDQKAQNLGSLGCSREKEKQQACTMHKITEPDQSASVSTVEGASSNVSPKAESSVRTGNNQVIGNVESESPSTSATESETVAEDYVSGDDDGDDSGGSYNDFIADTMIAEMEADIYGLQIIRNADLEEIRELGSGTYGTVYHGKWRGTDVAIKRIKKTCISGGSSEEERLVKDFWREALILSNLHHPNIVAFYGVVPDGEGGTLATVTEYLSSGSLKNSLIKKDRSLDCPRRLMIALDAAIGMEYLHSKNIVHFDMKCENLLVNLWDPQRPICKVGDFGLSRIKHNTLLSGGVRGTLPWMAPELLNGNTDQVSEKVDVFSFGIAMWEILTGEEPYADMHCGAIIGGIVKDNLRPPVPEECDPYWRKLMEECWLSDPEARPSFSEITCRLREMCVNLLARWQRGRAIQPDRKSKAVQCK
ncbi:hypothetical protein ACH5RR_020365 [Cinchona calisaya]|uniref:Protein kinase domain-containing protein n=1 Tax=Cinchona calisaya TaxID=153742 RepID=A0ABD2ZE87_9GENT